MIILEGIKELRHRTVNKTTRRYGLAKLAINGISFVDEYEISCINYNIAIAEQEF